jgi:hypothetical protein
MLGMYAGMWANGPSGCEFGPTRPSRSFHVPRMIQTGRRSAARSPGRRHFQGQPDGLPGAFQRPGVDEATEDADGAAQRRADQGAGHPEHRGGERGAHRGEHAGKELGERQRNPFGLGLGLGLGCGIGLGDRISHLRFQRICERAWFHLGQEVMQLTADGSAADRS